MAAFDGFDEGFASTEYGKISYLCRRGGGKAIVFLHGIGGSLKTWNGLVPFLPNGFNIYLMDLLGHGKSDAPDIGYDITVQVKVLGDFIQGLGIERPVLFGHSYGGWASILYSLQAPVSGLVIEDSAGMESQEAEVRNAGKIEEDRKALIDGSVKIGANERVIRSAAGNFGRHTLTDEILSKVSQKTLLIWGDNDDLVDIRFGRELRDHIRGSELLVIPGGGHVPHRAKPGVVGQALSDFLAAQTFK